MPQARSTCLQNSVGSRSLMRSGTGALWHRSTLRRIVENGTLQKDLDYEAKYEAKKNLKNTQCEKGAHLNLAPHLFSETASYRLSHLCTQDKTLEKKVVEEANKFIIAKGFPCVFRTRREADG